MWIAHLAEQLYLKMVHLAKDSACQTFTVNKFAPLCQGRAFGRYLRCQAIQGSEHLHAPVVNEVSLQ